MSGHAVLSPSSAARWMACPGSIAQSEGLPDKSSDFADEGTDAHELAAMCLEQGTDADTYMGQRLTKGNVVNLDMAANVQKYLDYVRDLVKSTGGELLVEQRLPIEHLTGEPGAKGTSDTVVLADDELIVVDLKYGRGVPVDAEDNPQLMIYALGALREFETLGDFTAARVVIHQPRLDSVSEWRIPIADLRAFGEQVAVAAEVTRKEDASLSPGEKQCKFCKAKGSCPALAARVQEEIGADFENLTTFNQDMTKAHMAKRESMKSEELGKALAAVDLIELWCKAVRGEVETRLLAGQPIPGFKLVQGKKGNRKWTSETEAEEMLKSMRVKHDQMYDYSLISPTTADKLQKADVIGPRQWPKLSALITQSEGKPSVAPDSDKRPALVLNAVADDFEEVTDAQVNATAEAECDLV